MENIRDNPFFVALKNKFQDIYKSAQNQKWIILVPQRPSLPSGSVSLRLIESHICKSSPYFQAEYVTLNDKTLEINDDLIVTKSGFSEKRKAKILQEETFYNASYQPYKVLCISKPLEGEVVSVSKASTIEIPDDFSFENSIKWLRSLGPLSVSPIEELEKKIREFNQTVFIAEGYEPFVLDRLKSMVQIAVQSLYDVVPDLGTLLRSDVSYMVESYAMGHMSSHIFNGLKRINQKADTYFESVMSNAKELPLHDLGLEKKFHTCKFDPAIAALNKLSERKTPMDKMLCLQKTIHLITQIASSQASSSGNPLCTDDLIPLVMFTVLQSNLKNIQSDLQYMEAFLSPEHASEELGFHLVTFQAAIEYLKTSLSQRFPAIAQPRKSASGDFLLKKNSPLDEYLPSDSKFSRKGIQRHSMSQSSHLKSQSHQRNTSASTVPTSTQPQTDTFLPAAKTQASTHPKPHHSVSANVHGNPQSFRQPYSRAPDVIEVSSEQPPNNSNSDPAPSVPLQRKPHHSPHSSFQDDFGESDGMGDFLSNLQSEGDVSSSSYHRRSNTMW